VVANNKYGDAPTTDEPVVASSMPSEVSVTYRSIPVLTIDSETPPGGTVGAAYGVDTLTEGECTLTAPDKCAPCASAVACAGLPVCQITATDTRPVVLNPPCVTVSGNAVVFLGTGGIPRYRWSAQSLPPGLTMDSTSSNVSGVPTAAGTYRTTITMTDSATPPDSTTATYQMVIAP
jgi:hypothetical protein